MWNPFSDAKDELANKVIAGQVRHLATAIAGVLATRGVVAQSDTEQVVEFVVAAVLLGVSMYKSYRDKQRSEAEIKVAAELPANTPRSKITAVAKKMVAMDT